MSYEERPTRRRRHIDWESIGFIAAMALTLLTWIATFVTFAIAIFIDRSPAEGNLAGLGILLLVVAFIFSCFVGVWADNI